MRDRHADHLAGIVAAGERRIGALDAQIDVAARELQRCVGLDAGNCRNIVLDEKHRNNFDQTTNRHGHQGELGQQAHGRGRSHEGRSDEGQEKIDAASETSAKGAVSFGARLAGSQAFADLFREGMALVENDVTTVPEVIKTLYAN